MYMSDDACFHFCAWLMVMMPWQPCFFVWNDTHCCLFYFKITVIRVTSVKSECVTSI